MLIFFFAVLLLIGLFGILKNLRKKYYKDVALIEKSPKFEEKIRELATSLPVPEPTGKGFDVAPIKSAIDKGFKVVGKKVRRGDELFSFEKWLYENHGRFSELFDKNDFEFCDFPHTGQPRVLVFARACVALSFGDVNKERFQKAFDEFSGVRSFTMKECEGLQSALEVALLEKIAAVSEKATYLEKMNSLSKASRRVAEKYVKNNVFMYLTEKNNPRRFQKIKTVVEANAKTCDDLQNVFDAFVAENDMLTENLVKSLINAKSVANESYKRLPVYEVACGDEVFSTSDENTKITCLREIGRRSDEINLDESEYAKRVLRYSESGLIGGLFSGDESLFESVKNDKKTIAPKKKNKKPFAYFSVFSVLLAAFAVASYFSFENIFGGIAAAVVSVFAYMPLSYVLTNKIFTTFLKKRYVFAKNFEKVPSFAKTDVIMPVFIGDEKSLSENVKRLNGLYLSNRDENVTFTLLIDFKKSKSATDESDAVLLKKLSEELPPYLRAAVRKRTETADGDFCGRERKRGAVEDYANFLYTKNSENFLRLFGFENLDKPRFFVTLDADSVLKPQSVLRAVNVFLHEENQKFDLLAFEGKTNAFSLKTSYARLFYGGDGYEVYPTYSNFFYDLTGCGIFTGKGIFDLDKYVEKLSRVLPENTVLSHDIVEGAILKTGVSGVDVYEDAPLNFSSDENRRFRWKRGDVQLLPFIGFTNPKDKFKKIDEFYGFLMFFNAFSVLSVSSLFVLYALAAAFGDVNGAILPTIAIFSNFVLYAIKGFFDAFVGLSVVAYLKNLTKEFLKSVFRLILMPYFAVADIVIFVVSVVRLITKKNLLLWKPFFAGKVKPEKRKKEKHEEYYLEHAELIYKYFVDSKTALVPDNFMVLPRGDFAGYTSPTDVGFSLLAEVCARILNLVDEESAKTRVNKILDCVARLEKYKGHLFNWYDVKSEKPLEPMFVSSVDSANFIVAAITTKEYFKGEIAEKIDKYLKSVDFSALFDKTVGLFYIGYDKSKNVFSGHYDNVVSESRLLSYLGVCFGMPVSSWDKLDRTFSSKCGRNFLLSYSGTAFEYKMPDLFLSVPKHGLFSSTSKIAGKITKGDKKHGLFGISESGYFDLDEANNFKYFAFGVSELSKRVGATEYVFSPYSTYIFADELKNGAYKNLKRFEKYEMLGEYGLYESLDARGALRIVPQFMAHHLGMSLVAITNLVKNDAVKKLFANADVVKCAEILLTEKQNEGKVKKIKKAKPVFALENEDVEKRIVPSAIPYATILSGNDFSTVLSDDGEGYSVRRGVFVNRFSKNPDDVSGGFFFVTDENGKTVTPTFAPFFESKRYSAVFSEGKARFENADDKVYEDVYAPFVFSGEVRRLYIENDGDVPKKFRVVFYERLSLNFAKSFASHPVYSDLFVKTYEKDGVFVATRKGKPNEKDVVFLMKASGAEFSYSGDAYDFSGRGNTEKNLSGIKNRKIEKKFGAVLCPAAIAFADVVVAPFSVKEIDVFTLLNDDEKTAFDEMRKTDVPSFFTLIENSKRKNETGKRFFDVKIRLVQKLLYEPYSNEKIVKICRYNEIFKKYSQNFEKKPLLFVYDKNVADLKRAVSIVKSFLKADIGVSLVVVYRDGDGYYERTKNEILSAISGMSIGKDVFLDDTTDFAILEDVCFCDFSKEYVRDERVENPVLHDVLPKRRNEIKLHTGEGGFSENSYEVVPFSKRTLLPYSNVVAGRVGGFVSSDGGGGYTFYGNSRESKLSLYRNDFTSDMPSERVLLCVGQTLYDLKRAAAVSHKKGLSEFSGESDDFSSIVSEYIADEGKCKIVEVEIIAKNDFRGKVGLYCALCLGSAYDEDFVFFKTENGIREAINVKNGISAYLKTFSGIYPDEFFGFSRGGEVPSSSTNRRSFSGEYEVSLKAGEKEKYVFVFGGDYESVVNVTPDNFEIKKSESTSYFEKLGPFSLKTDDEALNALFKVLPYQITSSRVNGKTSAYQAGGATGFRDMAQDLLSFVYFDKSRTRELLLELCAHVYFEGDVMHWWHGEKHGVRTRISDDGLFLVYSVANYVDVTGDTTILSESVGYLDSPLLDAREESRYENPKYHERKESVAMHLERILERAYDVGENGLLKIKGGDWNDALNSVGTDSAGESVWLSEFYIAVLKKVGKLYDANERTVFSDRIRKLEKAVLDAYEDGRFKRLVTASGEWLGDGKSDVMKIDAISEAWASLSEISDKNKVNIALSTAKKCLFDKENGMFLLLAPPFDDKKYYGYIGLYPKGVRENGGQYTHGAIWFVLALINEKRVDEAYEIFKAINPVEKCKDKSVAKRYKGEPYVLAADVYSNEAHKGRAGWTWYTGSASWCYKTILEGFVGVSVRENRIVLNPSPPKALKNYEVVYDDGKSEYVFRFSPSDKFALFENGVDKGFANAIPIKEGERRVFDVKYEER